MPGRDGLTPQEEASIEFCKKLLEKGQKWSEEEEEELEKALATLGAAEDILSGTTQMMFLVVRLQFVTCRRVSRLLGLIDLLGERVTLLEDAEDAR